MKRVIIIAMVLLLCSGLFAIVTAEVIEVKETRKGIINIKVEYTENGIVFDTITYTISSDLDSQTKFNDVDSKKYLAKNKAKFADGSNYDLIPEKLDSKGVVKVKIHYKEKKAVKIKPVKKIYDIKVGDKK